jgi:tetratricopeptide (TPR) repeat protein
MTTGGSSPGRDAERLFEDYLRELETGDDVPFEDWARRQGALAPSLREIHSAWLELRRLRARVATEDAIPEPRSSGESSESADGAPQRGDAPTELESFLRRLRDRAARSSRYEVRGEIGRGSMGSVLEVWDRDLRRSIAMKSALAVEPRPGDAGTGPDSAVLARFLEEAQITGQLDHPGIVPVHELGLGQDGSAYFTMRLVRGEDLRKVFDDVRESRGGWSQVRALNVLLRVCEAMSYAHAKGVIHRDLKPANVMVGAFGEVYVMDWGLARVVGRGEALQPRAEAAPGSVRTERRDWRARDSASALATMEGDVVGTPAYMAPEQARGRLEQLGPWTDVYALGALLYQLLAGEMPFVSRGERVTQVSVLMRVIEGPPRPLAQVAPAAAPELVAICEKAMERDPSRRYPDTRALADDLRAFLENRVVRAHETGAWAEARKWVGRNRLAAGAVAASLLAVVGGAVAVAAIESRARLDSARNQFEIASTNAALAAQRGSWRDALVHIAAARATGLAAGGDLLLDAAEAHLALYEIEEALGCLDAHDRAPSAGTRGRAELVRARTMLLAERPWPEVLERLDSAREHGLSAADDAVAASLQHEDSGEAIELLDAALRSDPSHGAAHELRIALLLCHGRLAEAEAEVDGVRMVRPLAAGPLFAKCLIRAAAGDVEGAEAWLASSETVLGEAERDAVSRAIELFAFQHEIGIEGWIGESPRSHAELTAIVLGAWSAFQALEPASRMRIRSFVLPSLPSIEGDYAAALRAAMGSTGLGFGPFGLARDEGEQLEILERLEAAVLRHDDAFLSYVLGCAVILAPARPGEAEWQRKARAAAIYARGAEISSWWTHAPRASLYWAIRCEAEAAQNGGDAAMRELALEHIRRALDRYELTDPESRFFGDIAFTLKDPGLAHDVCAAFLERHPDDLEWRGRRAGALWGMELYERAIEAADEVLREDPDNDRAQGWRSKALRDLAARK